MRMWDEGCEKLKKHGRILEDLTQYFPSVKHFFMNAERKRAVSWGNIYHRLSVCCFCFLLITFMPWTELSFSNSQQFDLWPLCVAPLAHWTPSSRKQMELLFAWQLRCYKYGCVRMKYTVNIVFSQSSSKVKVAQSIISLHLFKMFVKEKSVKLTVIEMHDLNHFFYAVLNSNT